MKMFFGEITGFKFCPLLSLLVTKVDWLPLLRIFESRIVVVLFNVLLLFFNGEPKLSNELRKFPVEVILNGCSLSSPIS